MGNLLATFLKESLFAQALERWKAKQTVATVYNRYRLPIYLAADELCSRFHGLSRQENERIVRNIGIQDLKSPPMRERHAMVSDHYLHYRFISNTYRLCSFLGRIELYRRDIGALDVETTDKNRRLEQCLRKIRSALADGWINQHPNQPEWTDCLIFREELRAIGSRMIAPGDIPRVIDFGAFYEIISGDPEGQKEGRWLIQAGLFFDRLVREKDFRLVRMRMIVAHLTELMMLLYPKRVSQEYQKTAQVSRQLFDQMTGGPKWRETPYTPELVSRATALAPSE
jgi:hypothetical protein